MTWRIFSKILCVGLSLGKNELVSVHTTQYLICSAFLNQLCHYLQALTPSWASLKAPTNRQGCIKTVHAHKTFFLPRAVSSWNIQFSQISCTFLSRKIHTKKQPRLPKTVVCYLQPKRKGILRGDLSLTTHQSWKTACYLETKKIWQLLQSDCIINEHISEL